MNAKILLRTVINIEKLEDLLKNNIFDFEVGETQIKVKVSFSKINLFEKIIKDSMNERFNYVNVKFPDDKKNVIIFPEKTFIINDDTSDDIAKKWALSIGLSKPETEWTICYK